MSIKVDPSQSPPRRLPDRDEHSRKKTVAKDAKQASVVAEIKPEISSPEKAAQVISGILKSEEQGSGSIAEAQAGLSEDRVLDLLRED